MRKSKLRSVMALLLGLTVLASLLSPMTPAFASGDSDTIYIKTPEDFVELAEHCTLDTWSQGKTVLLQADALGNTGCLALALLNSEGIPSSCEGSSCACRCG